jgi:hypothetical protein
MTFLGQLRRRPRLIRSVFAVFVLAWLQTAILPCAMAMTHAAQGAQVTLAQSTGSDTPAAHMAPAAMSDMPGCVYCPARQNQHGDNSSSDHNCLFPHESRVDSGKAQQARLDQLLAQPVFISSFIFSFLLEQRDAVLPLQYLVPPLSERSLNLTHCKQLK